MELFVSNDGLVAYEEWIARIDALHKNTKPSTKEQLKRVLIAAIKKRIPKEPFGLFLSGGVDSSFIALELQKAGANFTCYTVGIEKSEDLEKSKLLAKTLNLSHKHHQLTLDDVERILKEIAPWYQDDERLKEENLAVLFGVAAVEYAAMELAKKDHVHIVFGGLGSEEIFAGYLRHEKANDVNEECWRGLKQMWRRDLIRDCTLAKQFHLDVRTPLLDPEVITEAMGIPADQKIKGDIKKYILREIASEEGLPDIFAWRKKSGAQYGSKFDTALRKLTKRAGFPFKKDYLKSLV